MVTLIKGVAMKKLKLSYLFWLLIMLLLVPYSYADAPEGALPSIEGSLKSALIEVLDRAGYMASSWTRKDLERGLSAFLWDNRRMLSGMEIPDERQVDLAVCLMLKRGEHGFDQYAGSTGFTNWCQSVTSSD